MHEEHRQRVRNRFLKEGISNFEPHNVLEFLLFYSIPRRDTNETAHALIDKFGSLAAVFDANINDLMSVDGIGENSAILLKLIPQLARLYFSEKNNPKKIQFNCVGPIGAYLASLFVGEVNEVVYIMMLDSAYRMICCRRLFEGSISSAHLQYRPLLDDIMAQQASMVVIAHNHPNGLAVPSASDIQTTRHFAEALTIIDVRLLEHFVVSGNKFMPILATQADLVKSFHSDDVAQFYGTEELDPHGMILEAPINLS